MIPKLFQLGPLSVYSYGLMLGIAFIVANYILSRELRRKGMNENIGATLTLICLIGGIGGSKLFYLLENPEEFQRGIFKAIFSPAGLTFYGGLIVAALSIFVYMKIKRIPFLKIADTLAPALILAYGIGRIGCLLAGDGDYGIPTTLPWGMSFAHGTAKPTMELREYFVRHPEEDTVYHFSQLSAQISGRDDFGYITKFDETVKLHPAPLYETFYSVLIFLVLWLRRKKWENNTGLLFGVYCMLSGGARFLVEFIRLNPLYATLSMSQWIGLALVALGAVLLVRSRKKPRAIAHIQLLTKTDCSLCVEMKNLIYPYRDAMGFEIEEIFIRTGDEYWNEYWDKIPVLLLDGRMIAKYRITIEQLSTRIEDYRKNIITSVD